MFRTLIPLVLPLALGTGAAAQSLTSLELEMLADYGNGQEWKTADPGQVLEPDDSLVTLQLNFGPGEGAGWWTIVVFRVWAATDPADPLANPTTAVNTMWANYNFKALPNQTIADLQNSLGTEVDADDFLFYDDFALGVADTELLFYTSKFLGGPDPNAVRNWAQPLLTGTVDLRWDGSPSWYTGSTTSDNDYYATWQNIQLGTPGSPGILDLGGFIGIAAQKQSGADGVSPADLTAILDEEALFVSLQPFAFRDDTSQGGDTPPSTAGIATSEPRFRAGRVTTIRIPASPINRGRDADSTAVPMLVTPGGFLNIDYLTFMAEPSYVRFPLVGGGTADRPLLKTGAHTAKVRVPAAVTTGTIDLLNPYGTLSGANQLVEVHGSLSVSL